MAARYIAPIWTRMLNARGDVDGCRHPHGETVQRFLERLPGPAQEKFSELQLDLMDLALEPPKRKERRIFGLRFGMPLRGHTYALQVSLEDHNAEGPQDDVSPPPLPLSERAAWFMAFVLFFVVATFCVVGSLYIIKSLLGIDVLPGHFWLHDLIFEK